MTPQTRTITLADLQARLAEPGSIHVFEALPRSYFDQGHLPSAVNLPHDRVRELAPTLAPRKDTPIVVYCASDTCQNSHVAANVLSSLGYADVSVFPGGKAAWQEAGLPLVSGTEVQS